MEPNRFNYQRAGLGALVVLLAIVLLWFPAVYGDYLWFGTIGYQPVFLTILGYKVGVFLLAFLLSFAVLYGSYRIARRNAGRDGGQIEGGLFLLAIGMLSFLFGIRYMADWAVILRFLNAVPFGVSDPIYGQEVSFYVFTLPFVNLVVGFVLWLVVVGLLAALAVYAGSFGLQERETPAGREIVFDPLAFLSNVRANAFGQVMAYVGLALVLLGVRYYIDRWELLYSTRGAVFGMGATDQAIFQPLLGLLAATAVLGGIAIVANYWLRDPRVFYVPIAILVGFLILGSVAGAAYQGFVVEPDEFNKEVDYIENEIAFTNDAFALDRIQEREFPVREEVSAEVIENNPGTIDNVRLWDPRPLLTTYNELQIFRTYYTFEDVDVDRYMIDGEETQVMISPREIDFEALPPESQSWVNRHLVYTHGFGVAMSPVGKTTGEGLPELYIRDIPPNSSVGIEVTQPRIYYGENTDTYTVVNTRTRELDYPSGGQNVYTNYEGSGGVPLDSTFRKVLYGAKFGDVQIFLSDSVTTNSKLQFNRDIQTRVRAIAPFLEYDSDPYIVVANGRLYWIYDAYTTTDKYPYSQRVDFKGQPTNYVRNSVKVVVDAYTGETTFYVAEDDDPIIQTYRNAFPGLFEDFDSMPTALQSHVRYPEDAFSVQANMFLNYHMKDPKVFYNKEDAWNIPDEVTRGSRIKMEPYYIIMSFPGEEEPEFVMIQPYIPRGKQNMIGWLAARSDQPNYGNLQAYLFSKQQLVFGPMQIESRIDQDTEISQRITLWSQAGSSVIRGNLLAIPIDDTILYVEPLFLESQETGSLPELKRVIVAQGDQLTMQPTLEEALAVRFGTAPDQPPASGDGVSPAQIERLQTLYDEADAALREGDFETYAERITEIGRILDRMEAQTPDNSTAE